MPSSRTLALTALFASFLAACGGGGGGGGSSAPTSAAGAPLAIGSGGSSTTSSGSSANPNVAAAFSAFDPVRVGSNPLPFAGAVARLAGGGNVAAWVAPGSTTRNSVVMAHRTDSAGRLVGAPITIKAEPERVSHVSVAPASDGGFLVAWAGFDTEAVTPGSVIVNLTARKYAADGSLQSESRLVQGALYDVSEITMEPMRDGGFVVGWSSKSFRTAPYWGFVQRLGAAGEPLGGPVALLGDGGGAEQRQLSVVPLQDGRVTVVWQQTSAPSPQLFSVYSRVFDASLQPVTPPTELAGTAQPFQLLVRAAASGSNVALAWVVPASPNSSIQSTVMAPGSANPGPVTSVTASNLLSDLRVEALGNGSFGVVWQEIEVFSPPPGSNGFLYLQRHDSTGAAASAPTQLLSRTISTAAGVAGGTVIALDGGPDGHIVGVVQAAGQTEPAELIFGR